MIQRLVQRWPLHTSVVGTMLTAVSVWRRHSNFRNAFVYTRCVAADVHRAAAGTLQRVYGQGAWQGWQR